MSGRFPGYFSSLRGKLTLWFILSIGGLMIIFSGLILFSVRLWMIQVRDTEAIKHTETTWAYLQRHDSLLTIINFDPELRGWLDRQSEASGFYQWVFSADSLPLFISKSVQHAGFSSRLQSIRLEGHPQFFRIPGLGTDYRCISYPVIAAMPGRHRLSGWVVTITSITDISGFLNDLTRVLLGMIIVGIVVAMAFSIIISELALRPLTDIMRVAQSININQLSTRIPEQREDEEIRQMAQTLNHLLDRLQNSFDQIKQFTADASHELLTPLTIIKGELELSLSRDRDKEYYKSSLANALGQTNQLIHVTQTLLKISRDEISEDRVDREATDMRILFAQLFGQLQFLASQKSIVLENHLGDQLPLVITNENLVHTLFFNLMENAIKYSPPRTVVTIRNVYKPVLGGLTIEVIDQGPGIPEQERDLIFRRFYRIEKSRSKETGGSGLGLSLVNKIQHLLGLKIEIRDNKPSGTVFIVTFPEQSILTSE